MFGITTYRPDQTSKSATHSKGPILERRELLRLGLLGCLGLSSGRQVASAQISPGLHTHPGDLSGILRTPMYQAPAHSLTNLNRFNNSYFSNSFGFYNYGLYTYPSYSGNFIYLNNHNRGVSFHNRSQQNTRTIQQQNCCCKPSQNGGIEEIEIKYPDLTPEKIIAREKLYESTVESLVRTGYTPATNSKRQEINRPQDLLYFLTPIVFAHDSFNDETLNDIQEGLKQGNRKLIDTYGSAKFFQDAIGVIKFHKVKSGELEGVKPEILTRDIDAVIAALKKIKKKERETDPSFSIDKLEDKAKFITRAYHYLSVEQLNMIWDAVDKGNYSALSL